MTKHIYKWLFLLLCFFSLSIQSQNCDNPVEFSDSCTSAPTFCREYLNDYCSSTGASNAFNPVISNSCPLENSIWVEVPVCETEVVLSLNIENCIQGLGVQVSLVSGADCQNFIAANPGCQSLPNNAQTNIQFDNLTAGELYYLVIDGTGADVCDFSIEVLSGITGYDSIPPPDTTTITPYMWEVVVPSYIEGEPNACISNGQYRLVPAVCQLVEGDCMRAEDDRSRAAPCDITPDLCPFVPTEFDTIVHWNIPPCVEIIGDSTSLDIELDFTDYIECYYNSGMQPWPVDSIPFNISADLELIPITTPSSSIFCSCQGVAQICNSCPAGADLPMHIKPDYINIDVDICPFCDWTQYGQICLGPNPPIFSGLCLVETITGIPLPDNDIFYGPFEVCPGECVDVEFMTFCGAGNYNFQTTNNFGCEVTAFVEIIEFPADDIDFGNFVITCNNPCISVDNQVFCSPGSYNWATSDTNGCPVQATVQVDEATPPDVFITSTDGNCASCGFAEANAFGGSGPLFYEWSGPGTGQFGSSIISCSSGTFQVTVTDINDCSSTASVTIIIDDELPIVNLSSSATTLSTNNTEIILTGNTNINNYDFQWRGPNGPINSGLSLDEITVTEPGTYSLIIINLDNGCEAVDDIIINSVQAAPQAMTPLGDLCQVAPYFCSEFLDGVFSTNDSATHDSLNLIAGCPMENSLWLRFSACDTLAQLSFFVDSCEQAQGLEFSIASTVDCDSFNIVGTPCQTIANGTLDTLSFDSLESGNVYYLIIDGIDADICNFEIGVVGGIVGSPDTLLVADTVHYVLTQLTDGSITGPNEVCAFTPNTYTFIPGTCAIQEGDCTLLQSNAVGRAATELCNDGACFVDLDQIELDTIVDWTLPNGTTIIGDSTDFDINIEFGLDWILAQYNGMIPTNDTDTVVVTLYANYAIVPISDTIGQDTSGQVYCNCLATGIICGSCTTGASLDVNVIIQFNEENYFTCDPGDCQDVCGQQLCPGGSVYCTAPCVLTTATMDLIPITQITYTDEICPGNCVDTPYGQYCNEGTYFASQFCEEITIVITATDTQNVVYPDEIICLGDCVIVGSMTFCSAGLQTWSEDLGGCIINYSVTILEFNSQPIDYGTATLCPNECFSSNDGQQFCTPGLHNFIEIDINGCPVDAMVFLIFESTNDVDLGTEFICEGDCYVGGNGPLCAAGAYNWTENQNGCDVNYSIIIEVYPNNPIDYGMIDLCEGACFTSGDGQVICAEGVHNFTEIDQNGCQVAATVMINILPIASLSTGPTTHLCNPTNDGYTVSFSIYGDPPFSVDGIQISGDFYTSGLINDGDNYSFEVKNAQTACPETTFVNGSYFCPLLNCNSDPGVLINTPNNLCIGNQLNINELNPVVLQDTTFDFEYLIHSDPDPLNGTVLLRNKTGIFDYDPILIIETEYYTSRIVGLSNNNNEVNLNGNCLKFTSGPAITFYENPQIDISPVDNLLLNCNQETLDLTAAASGGSGVWSFNWSVAGIPSTAATITIDQAGIYRCELVDQETGCLVQAEVTVAENFDSPTVAIIEPQSMLNCTISELELIADVFPPNGNIDIQWTGPSGNLPTGTPFMVMANEPGWYFINIENLDSGCANLDSMEVFENTNIPTAFLTDIIQPKCADHQFGSIDIMDVEGGTPPYELFIDNQSTTEMMTNLAPGNYRISLIDQNGCSFEEEIEIIAAPILESNLTASITVNYGETIRLDSDLNFDPYFITWSDASQNALGNEELLELTVFENQRISLTAQDEKNCVVENNIQIVVKELEPAIFIPTAFSPNGDEFNDHFELFGNATISKVNKLQIFSRWGALVFEASDFEIGDAVGKWDGTINGKKLNAGVFIYQTSFTMINGEQQTKTGDLVLLK